jgi:hypothetical protein
MKKFTEIARLAFQRSRDDTSILFLKSSRKAFAVVLLILAVATTSGFAHAESIVGKISSVNGAVQIVRDGKTLIATNGMAIRVHDKVVTGADGSVTIVMPDHSLLHLDQSGTLLIGKSAAQLSQLRQRDR